MRADTEPGSWNHEVERGRRDPVNPPEPRGGHWTPACVALRYFYLGLDYFQKWGSFPGHGFSQRHHQNQDTGAEFPN